MTRGKDAASSSSWSMLFLSTLLWNFASAFNMDSGCTFTIFFYFCLWIIVALGWSSLGPTTIFPDERMSQARFQLVSLACAVTDDTTMPDSLPQCIILTYMRKYNLNHRYLFVKVQMFQTFYNPVFYPKPGGLSVISFVSFRRDQQMFICKYVCICMWITWKLWSELSASTKGFADP